MSSNDAPQGQRLAQRFVGLIRRHPIKSVALVGAVAASVVSKQKREQKEEALAKKKKVLVLPFYKMNIVEKSKRDFRSMLQKGAGDSDGGDKTVEMEVDELVTLIHQAANDPNVVALYGIFGQGHGFKTGGWAHIQEIRNALLVFQQSHRVHKEPSFGANKDTTSPKQTNGRKKKTLYAYANTFASPLPGGDGMKEYYLASVFTHIHLQPQGDLNLFGLHTTGTFLADCLKKYGVQVDVFKHGAYKNFANQFTHSKYTKEHRENVEGILNDIQQQVCDGIYTARNNSLKNFEFSNFWKMVHQAGSFPADIAHKVGFVDFMPRKDPLQTLLDDKEDKEARKKTWGTETDLDQFGAEAQVSIADYARLVKRKDAQESRQWSVHKKFKDMAEQCDGIDKVFAAAGFPAPHYNIPESDYSEEKAQSLNEKIAVVKIGGAIMESTARKVEKALRKLKHRKDIKAIVLRVDSPGGAVTACETIHQEIQDLPQKVVVSFGNVSASGGYYISANADRIFASPMTVTGSIGVFMIRLDLRGLAKQYGITFDSVASSEMSGSFDPFYPINHRMKDNFASYADRTYMHFKTLVGNGRGMDLDMVETVAQGRVWTGEQAKRIGLVDELGGLERAIAYAQRNYTSGGHATVVSWPPKKSVFEFLSNRGSQDEGDLDDLEVPSVLHYFVAPMKEFLGVSNTPSVGMGVPRFPAMSGMMLTVDENWAIRCLLQENDYTDLLSEIPAGFFD